VTAEDSALEDAAKRISGEMTMHALALVAGAHDGGWVAFWLADGRPLDHTVYPLRTDAVKAAKWDRDHVIYLEVQPDAMSVPAAKACLTYARTLHKMGFRIPSPDFSYDATMPLLKEDRAKQILHLASGGKRS
jgi:hypothetical protein